MSDPNPYVPPPESVQYKNLIVCCDGTGKSSSTGQAKTPTNVFRFAQALKTSERFDAEDADPANNVEHKCARETSQVVLYQTGIGADGISPLSNAYAQAFGAGIDIHILEAYNFLANNYETGDFIYIFGFSRGAYTARAIASLICNVGLLKPDSLQYLPLIYEQYKLRRDEKETRNKFDTWMKDRKAYFQHHQGVIIWALGLWDTVGSLGVPETPITSIPGVAQLRNWWNGSYGYHDTSLPIPKVETDENSAADSAHSTDDWKSYIACAYQALSLEESRTSFGPTLLYNPILPEGTQLRLGELTGIMQCWFPGIHTDVGGGYDRAYRDISDISLLWMIEKCKIRGLYFRDDNDLLNALKSTSSAKQDPLLLPPPPDENTPKDLGWALSKEHDEYHTPTFLAGGSTDRTPGEYFLDKKTEEGYEYDTEEFMHPSVRMRMMRKKNEDGSNWKPPALNGFKLVKREENAGWMWVKEVKVNGKPTKVTIQEDSLMGSEMALLTPEEKRWLEDDKLNEAIEMVPPKPEGWTQWAKNKLFG